MPKAQNKHQPPIPEIKITPPTPNSPLSDSKQHFFVPTANQDKTVLEQDPQYFSSNNKVQ